MSSIDCLIKAQEQKFPFELDFYHFAMGGFDLP